MKVFNDNELIKKWDAIVALLSIDEYNPKSIQAIRKLPTIESEREKSEWIYTKHDVAMCDGYICDQCGFFVPWDYSHKSIDFIKDYHYCPSCGKGMRVDYDYERAID